VESPLPPAKAVLPNPKPLNLEVMVKWKVLIKDRLPENDKFVYYCVVPKDYEKLARNNAEVLRWIKEARWRLDYYRDESKLDGRK